ncbi:MAG: hypothetical protein FWD73_02130 [Polyangiaceae bacterium]|nr:hypothetical protein [Polyangiaceae bacterium]
MKIRIIAPSVLGIVFAFTAQAAAQTAPPPTAQPQPAGAAAPATTEPAGDMAPDSTGGPAADVATPAPPPEEAPKKKPAPYSLPWSLRGAVAGTSIRLDAAVAFHDKGLTVPGVLTASYKFVPDLAVLVKASYAYDKAKGTDSTSAFYNPVVGLTYTPQLAQGIRLPLFVGTNIPMGSGGGGSTKTPEYASTTNAIYARSGLDNALFGVNFVTPMVGAGLAYIQHGLTLQGEATLTYLKRTRGSAYEADNVRWNSTYGVHVGYAIIQALTVSAELRYQRWLSNAAPTKADTTKQDQFSGALGLRTKISFSETVVARPGVAYIRGLDKPMSKGLLAATSPDQAPFNIIFVDIPVSF